MLENLNKRIEKYGLHFAPQEDMRHNIICLLETLEGVVDRKEDRIKTLEEKVDKEDRIKTLEEEMKMVREFLAL